MNKSNFTKSILIILLVGIFLTTIFNTNSSKSGAEYQNSIESNNNSELETAQNFELLEDFEASTYYISPETSPGQNDEVFFSFMANKEGNYTLQVENFPNFITKTESSKSFVSSDNPSGTNNWYVAYSERDSYNLGQVNYWLMKSENKGKTWNNTLVKRINSNATDLSNLLTFSHGIALAANPETGFIIITTWINTSELCIFRSFDNGTTWSIPIKIHNSTVMGTHSLINLFSYPKLDIGIMQNGSILIISESDDAKFTDLVYIVSHDNGSSWSLPNNITSSTGDIAYNPKIQVDHNSGKYWIMWRDDSVDRMKWAEYLPTQTPSVNVQNYTISGYTFYLNSYDFHYDFINNKLRFIFAAYDSGNSRIENYTCHDISTNSWSRTILGVFKGIGSLYSNYYLNYIYNQENYLIYEADYLGSSDIYQFEVLQNYIFWKEEGKFFPYQLKQIIWNGKKSDMSPIQNSLVRAIFIQNHTSEIKSRYIIIDNDHPQMEEFVQKLSYFNPLSSNITLTNIPWEIMPSESCNAFLQIFSEQSSSSSWYQILENNWEDSDPKFFYSYSGILYLVYLSEEAGSHYIYLIKSYDMGATWSNPVKVFEKQGYIQIFYGCAIGDAVFIYIKESHEERFFFRSFDQGDTFQNAINIYDINLFPDFSCEISGFVITNNGTMFITHKYEKYGEPAYYYILRSDKIGINWTISKIFKGDETYDTQSFPDLAYDPVNDIVHFAMPMDNYSFLSSKIVNFSFSMFNFTENSWSPLKSVGIYSSSFFDQDSKFIITRDNLTARPKVRFIYLYDIDLMNFKFYYKEIVSEDLGDNWSEPTDLEIESFTDIFSNLEELFFIKIQSDGNDGELFFRRVGKLVRGELIPVSSASVSEIIFDGINDFGEYIDEGMYNYTINLIDYAGNTISEKGWFYADYNAPNIIEHFTNNNIPPIPINDLTITVNITENTNCTTYLFYKKDGASWQKVLMNPIGNGYHTGTIPGDSITDQIQYYIKSTDLAGNEFILDNNGEYYSYGMPSFSWDSEGLFKESKSYSSSQDYEIAITIESDLEYVDEVIFRYSYDEGEEWNDLELEQNSPEFSGELDDIPGDLRELHYKVIVIDIYGEEHELTDTREVEFYPEVPSVAFEQGDIALIMVISAIIGIVVGIGYIKLKSTSHETMYKQIFLKDYAKKIVKTKKPSDDNVSKNLLKRFKKESTETQFDVPEEIDSSTPFTKVYLGILCGTVSVFSIALLFSVFAPPVGMLILSASLLMGVFGYMILMSRDITLNIYLERIYLKNIALEVFQIFFMFINIIAILLVGFTIDWFRYYLIESTYNIGSTSIPRLYFSIFAVFFTSLVLVGITTYIQLRKTVKNLQQQSSQGASPNLLLYMKDQNASRLITRLGYKTVIFLVTILLAVVTTTNLLTEETGIALLVIIIPFAIAGFLTLMIHRYYEMRSKERKKVDIQLPFSDSKKFCSNCGKEIYLSNKFCGACGSQQVYEEMFGTYISRCSNCNSLVNDKAQYCTECGKKVQNISKMKE
ncbi:MAG: hypothetical protein EU535_03715 [Promethearchaeota archaeon]|nr:MAG: hypothetical protein EU535_03715 [Candidatus Lokiarchaeota archaeon]